MSSTPLPVMMFVHGGGFHCGSGRTMEYGPDFLLDHDIVLVVINYRLGALGFLSTGDDVVPGNNGMKDQTMALKWIKENIQQFGGDPNMVTVFGESAGGASSHLHMFSPLSQGLVHRVISESGSAFENWAIHSKEEGLRLSQRLATSLGCPIDCSQKMVECLRGIDALTIVKHQESFYEWQIEPMVQFIPTIEPDTEDAFIVDWPRNIVKKNKDRLLPWMNGLNTEDGALRTSAIITKQTEHEFDEKFDLVMKISTFDALKKPTRRFIEKIKQFYFGSDSIGPQHKENITNLYTDVYFTVNGDEAVSSLVKHSKHPVYYYLFGYRGASSFTEPFGRTKENFGVCHADELIYLFPISDGLFPDTEMTKMDLEMARVMTGMWANFAKHGNPTPERSALTWKPVQTARNEYMFISNDVWEMRDSMHSERLAFWRDLIENADKFERNEL